LVASLRLKYAGSPGGDQTELSRPHSSSRPVQRVCADGDSRIPRPKADPARRTLGAMNEPDDVPRRPDLRVRVVAIVLILCLVATVAPFLASLVF